MAHTEQWQETMIDAPRRALRDRMAAQLERQAAALGGPAAQALRAAAARLEGEAWEWH